MSILLSGGDIRHKDDRQALKVTRVTISSKEGEVEATDVPAIFREGRRLVDFIGALADIIKKKDGVCDDAPEGLTHLNLIIRDRNRMLSYHPCSTFYPIVCTAELRQAVFASRFREIYFITAFQEGDAFIPLKMILTLAKIYMAVGFLRVSEHKDRFERFDDFMRWFAHYLSTITVSEVRLREEGEEVEVLYGNTGFLITGCGVVLHDYTDFPFPESAVMIPDSGWDDLGACSGMPGYEQSNLFQCGMVFAVRTGAVLENEENQQGA